MTLAHLVFPLLLQAGAELNAQDFAPDCTEPQTQRAMNHCAALEWEEADAALNAQWQETAAAMRRMDRTTTPDDGRPGYFSQLLRGQRAWLVYRDQHCASVGYSARGGSLEPLLVSTCKTDLTRERTGQLRALAKWPR